MHDVRFNESDSVQARCAALECSAPDSLAAITLNMAVPLHAPDLDWGPLPPLPGLAQADAEVP